MIFKKNIFNELCDLIHIKGFIKLLRTNLEDNFMN